MIVDEQAQEHAARQLFKDLQRREKKKKKKKRHYEEDVDDKDDDETYHLSQDFLPGRNSGMQMRKVTCK